MAAIHMSTSLRKMLMASSPLIINHMDTRKRTLKVALDQSVAEYQNSLDSLTEIVRLIFQLDF